MIGKNEAAYPHTIRAQQHLREQEGNNIFPGWNHKWNYK